VLPACPSWQRLDEMLTGDQPLCEGVGGVPCGRPVEVAWRATVVTARWTCAWHWPVAMGATITPVVFAVRSDDGWVTWREAGEWDLFRLACGSFAACADAIPDRSTLAAELRPELASRLYGVMDHNQSAVLWAVAITNCVPDPVPLTNALLSVRDTGPYLPSELCWVDVEQLGLRLVLAGQESWAAGDVHGALARWRSAAEGARSTIAMGRIAEVAHGQGDLETARQWWTRSATLGNTQSMTSLGALYTDSGDLELAIGWLERAASAGSVSAMFNLGVVAHRQGTVSAARYWFGKARDGGDTDAAAALERLPKR
jgi:hypothetical protein